uniref:Uncharacterized protein n=1 Tax=Glossina pallidipes TaxID=7398 RepID=A0A1A9ZEY7_GLOPL
MDHSPTETMKRIQHTIRNGKTTTKYFQNKKNKFTLLLLLAGSQRRNQKSPGVIRTSLEVIGHFPNVNDMLVLVVLLARLAILVPLCDRLVVVAVVVVTVPLDFAKEVPDILSKSAVFERSIASPIFVILAGGFGSGRSLRNSLSKVATSWGLQNILTAGVHLKAGTDVT